MKPNTEREFWKRTRRVGKCLVWQATTFSNGYGRFSFRGKACGTHRLAYEFSVGPVPAGLFVCHSCDNKRCVEPSHLFLGTAKDNADDLVRKNKQLRGDAHGSRKLSSEGVRTIRNLHAAGVRTKAELAREYGVSDVLVGKIVRRELWR